MNASRSESTGSNSIRIAVLISAFLIVSLACVFITVNEFPVQDYINFVQPASFINNIQNYTTPSVARKPAFRLLIGILTLPGNYERRHLLRLVYGIQSTEISQIDVKFVFCNLTNEEQQVLITLEIMRFNDIIVLDCAENMNTGKTYTYLSSLPEILNGTVSKEGSGNAPPYDYVMKADDDIFFRLERLAESLEALPREDLYYGFVIPCDEMDPFGSNHYMSGMGFILSWDLVEWVRNSSYAKNHTVGPEDMVVGDWLNFGRRAKHRFNTKPAMYDFPIPVPIDTCSHEFIPDTIAVHRLKSMDKWVRTLKYFNVTDRLKPSKLYHIP